jgi:CTD small phosphatase-like protein 2
MLAQKKVFLPKRPTHKDKKTIIFDLDETLIHCNESSDIPSDVVLPIKFPHGEIIEAGINVRPYAIEILKEISQHFEVIVFTASHSCYANVVLDYLDPHQQYIHHRLFRESCVVSDEGVYIKDLRVFGNRNLQDIVLVDNAAYSYGYQVENGIPIIPFYDNKEDQELKHLIPYLKSLAGARDCRDVNKQTFKLHAYTMYDSLDKVLNKVILQN